MEYASKAQGDLGVTLASIGLGLGVLNGSNNGGLLSGILGGGQQYVSRETYDVQNKLIEAERANALLAAELNTEKKVVESYTATIARINEVEKELSYRIGSLEKRVDDNAAAQAVINCGFTSAISVLQTQAAQFMSLTKIVIPDTNICPPPTTSA